MRQGTRMLALAAALAAGMLGSAPGTGQAQTAPKVFFACYVPSLAGTVYRIKEPGLNTKCFLPGHVEFSWTQQGPKGDPGAKGDPGNLALAGQACPPGLFVTGFSGAGTIVCEAVGGGGGGGGGSSFNGTWAFTPVVSTQCVPDDPTLPPFSLTTDGGATTLGAPDRLDFAVRFNTGIYGISSSITVGLAFDAATGAFNGSGAVPPGAFSGTVAITGAFTGTDAFAASVALTGLTAEVTLPSPFGTVTFACDPVNTSVIGTRVGT